MSNAIERRQGPTCVFTEEYREALSRVASSVSIVPLIGAEGGIVPLLVRCTVLGFNHRVVLTAGERIRRCGLIILLISHTAPGAKILVDLP